MELTYSAFWMGQRYSTLCCLMLLVVAALSSRGTAVSDVGMCLTEGAVNATGLNISRDQLVNHSSQASTVSCCRLPIQLRPTVPPKSTSTASLSATGGDASLFSLANSNQDENITLNAAPVTSQPVQLSYVATSSYFVFSHSCTLVGQSNYSAAVELQANTTITANESGNTTLTVDASFANELFSIPPGATVHIHNITMANVELGYGLSSAEFGKLLVFKYGEGARLVLENVVLGTTFSAVSNYIVMVRSHTSTFASSQTDQETYVTISNHTTATVQLSNVTIWGERQPDDNTPQYYYVYSGSELLDLIQRAQTLETDSIINLRGNMTLPRSSAAKSAMVIQRDLALRGSPHHPTVVDAQLNVNLFSLTGSVSVNLTRLNLVNLARGDSVSASTAPGSAVQGISPLWLFAFPRTASSAPRMYVTNCTIYIPLSELQWLTYWGIVLNSPSPVISSTATWLRSQISKFQAQLVDDLTLFTTEMVSLGVAYYNVTWTAKPNPLYPLLAQDHDPAATPLDPTTIPPYVLPVDSPRDFSEALFRSQSDSSRTFVIVPWANITAPAAASQDWPLDIVRSVTISGEPQSNVVLDTGGALPLVNVATRAMLTVQHLHLINLGFLVANDTTSASFTSMAFPVWTVHCDRSKVCLTLTATSLELPAQEFDYLVDTADNRQFFFLQPFANDQAMEFTNFQVVRSGPEPYIVVGELSGLGLSGRMITFTRGAYNPKWIAPPRESDTGPLSQQWQVAILVVGLVVGLALVVAIGVLAYLAQHHKQAFQMSNSNSSASKEELAGCTKSEDQSVRALPEDAKEQNVDQLTRIMTELTGEIHSHRLWAASRSLHVGLGDSATDAVRLEGLLGEGTYGKVYKAYWKGSLVAVKSMVLPSSMSGKERRERMAIMETAISTSVSHPNVVQTFTYFVRPVKLSSAEWVRNNGSSQGVGLSHTNTADNSNDGVHSWEVWLVLEYCDKGTLRALLDRGLFCSQSAPKSGEASGSGHQPRSSLDYASLDRDYLGVVDTALDVARAMVHLHSENIVHSDLKASNILLKEVGGQGRGFVAKVSDFGLSLKIDPTATHVSNAYQGTLTHMAPEVLMAGKVSKASDVYAFGILLWELYTGSRAFQGIPKALIGHEITRGRMRPEFPRGCPLEYQLLACRCWETDPAIRPTFDQIMDELTRIRNRVVGKGMLSASGHAVFNAGSRAAGIGAPGPSAAEDDSMAWRTLTSSSVCSSHTQQYTEPDRQTEWDAENTSVVELQVSQGQLADLSITVPATDSSTGLPSNRQHKPRSSLEESKASGNASRISYDGNESGVIMSAAQQLQSANNSRRCNTLMQDGVQHLFVLAPDDLSIPEGSLSLGPAM